MMRPSDFVQYAMLRVLAKHQEGWQWVWNYCMDARDHLKFDGWLTEMDDPIRLHTGTPQQRFCSKVIDLAEIEGND